MAAARNYLSRYEGPTAVVERRGELHLYDAGSGEIIATFTADAAADIRANHPTALVFDGHGHVTKADRV